MADSQTQIAIQIDVLLRGLQKTMQGLARVEKQLKTVAAIKLGGSNTTFDKAAASAQRLQQQQQRLIVQAKELEVREQRAKLALDRLTASQERLNRAAATSRLGKQADEHVRQFRHQEREARRAQRVVDRANAESTRQAKTNIRQLEHDETRLANHRIREAKRAQRATTGTARGAQGGGAFFGGSLLGFAGAGPAASAVGVALGLTIFQLTSRLTEGGRAWIDYASKVQNARIAFTTMLGGVADADKHLRDLQKFALETPFAFDELIDASQRMQALGFSSSEVIPILRDVGNAVAAAGGGSERLERVIKALADVRARGTLQSQEIRQFAEAGISAFQVLREETGKTTVELQDMVEKGQISADFFIAAFRKFSQVHFGDLMEQQSKTFLGALSNIRDVLLQVASKAFEPLFSKISEISVRVQAELQKVSSLDQAADVMAQAFIELGGFLAEKIAEGIVTKFASTQFQIQLGSFISRSVANLIGTFGRELQNRIAEAATGRTRGETTLLDIHRAEEKRAKGLKGVNLAAAAAQDRLRELGETEQRNIKITEKAAEIYVDLIQKLGDVSSVSLELGTRQQLLRAGVTDLNSGYAELAISLARAADAQRDFNEQQEVEAKRVRDRNQSLREQLEAVRDTSRLAIAEVQAEPEGLSELERFNTTLGAQVDGVLNAARASNVWNDELQGLADSLAAAREEAIRLDTAIADRKRQEENVKLLKERAKLTQSLIEIQRELGIQLRAQGSAEFQFSTLEETAERVTSLFDLKLQPGAFDPLIDLFKSERATFPKTLELVQQILSSMQADLGPAFDSVSQAIANAFRAARQVDRGLKEASDRAERLQQLSIGLRIEEERIQDRVIDGTLTERQAREEMLALQRRYRDELLAVLEVELQLAAARNDQTAVLNIQREIEETQRLGKVVDEVGQQINRDLFDNLTGGIEGIFNSALDGIDSVKDAVADLGRSILAVINRVAAESLVEEIFGDLLKPGAGNTQGTLGGLLGRIFGIGGGATQGAADAGAGAAVEAARGAKEAATATAVATALTTGGAAASTAMATGGAAAGTALVTGGAAIAASVTAAAAAFSAAVIAAGAAFAAAVGAGAAASGAGSALGSIGAATGLFPAVPGGAYKFVEGGYPEAVLTTDPRHASRQLAILREYLHRTKGLFGRIQVPEMEAGGFMSAREAEINLLSTIQRGAPASSSVPGAAIAGVGGTDVHVRQILVDDQRRVGDFLNSPQGEEVQVQFLYKHAHIISRIAGRRG